MCESRTGQLAAVQAKNLLLGTGLAQQTLAGVWNLADIDKDGRYHGYAFEYQMLTKLDPNFLQAS